MSRECRELDAALAAATEAGVKIMETYQGFQAIANAPADITTQADRDSQDLIFSRLFREFPGDGFVGEESTEFYRSLPKGGSRTWIVDPIDGTRGFAKKIGEFCIMIALVEHGEPVVGVVHDPANGRTTYAFKGGGCHARDNGMSVRQLRVRQQADLSSAIITKSHSRQKGMAEGLSAKLGASIVHETYSAGLKLARVARGEADIYVNDYPTYNEWDICAGHILVTEAGGSMTDINGNPIRYGEASGLKNTGFIASNGLIHAEVVKILGNHRGS